MGYSVTPDLCTLHVDVRTTRTFEDEDAARLLKHLVAQVDDAWPGTQPNLIQVDTRWPAFALTEDSRLRTAILDVAANIGIEVEPKVTGPSNIGNYLGGLNIPATAGFGVDYVGLHGTDERIRLDTNPHHPKPSITPPYSRSWGRTQSMADLPSLTAAWDRYTTEHRHDRFTWATTVQATNETPGAEVLAVTRGNRVLDLGCGAGDNAAHVAQLGAQVTGIDLSPVQVATARQRWSHLAKLTVEQGEAAEYLNATSDTFDAMYSVFGAVWFTDPDTLLPLVKARLRPVGVFAFSQADVQPATGRCTLDNPSAIERWDYRPSTWSLLLRAHGFRQVTTRDSPRQWAFGNGQQWW